MVQFLHLRIDEVQKLHYYKLRGAIMMGELKKMRTEKKMTQQQVADLVGISLRSYKSYENDEKKQGSLKYKYILEKLSKIKLEEGTKYLSIISDSFCRLSSITKISLFNDSTNLVWSISSKVYFKALL